MHGMHMVMLIYEQLQKMMVFCETAVRGEVNNLF